MEESQNIFSLNLSSYVRPEVEEVANREWVDYQFERVLPDKTETQNYFDYVIDRYYGSPTNNAAINGIVSQIFGKGYAATDSARKAQEWANFISKVPQKEIKNLVFDAYLQGQGYLELIKSGNSYKVYHTPTRNWRAEKCNEEGDVVAYYYASDWEKVERREEEPIRVPALGFHKDTDKRIVMCVRDYSPGNYYYSPPKYQGCIPHAEMEEEIANFHICNIQNGLSPTMLINMNNGDPGEEKKALIKNQIRKNLQGSSAAGNFILSFNNSSENAATIESAPIKDAHAQYEFLSREASEKILVGHRITSPKLIGVTDKNNGLGNNAEEIKTASQLFDNTVIRPLQEMFIETLDNVAALLGYNFDFYFTTIQPIEFVEANTAVQDAEEIEKETGVKLSSDECACSVHLSAEQKERVELIDNAIADELEQLGEDEEALLGDYELIDVSEVDYETDKEFNEAIQAENEAYAKKQNSALNKIKQAVVNLVSTGTARPNAKSEQDGLGKSGDLYKVRYEYSPKRTSADSRQFCKRMVSAGKIYRKEDIVQMSKQPVNAGFGELGAATYDIWLYKGGARCSHKWFRKIYVKKSEMKNVDVKSPNAPTASTLQARREGFRPEANDSKVAVAPNDMRYKGFSPRNRNMPADARAQSSGI